MGRYSRVHGHHVPSDITIYPSLRFSLSAQMSFFFQLCFDKSPAPQTPTVGSECFQRGNLQFVIFGHDSQGRKAVIIVNDARSLDRALKFSPLLQQNVENQQISFESSATQFQITIILDLNFHRLFIASSVLFLASVFIDVSMETGCLFIFVGFL